MRSIFIKIGIGFFSLIAFISLIFLYSYIFATRSINVENYTINNNKIPATFNAIKVVQFSDIYIKNDGDVAKISELRKKVNAIKPQIIIFSGNLLFEQSIIDNTEVYKNIQKELSLFQALLGKFAILSEKELQYSAPERDAIKSIYSNTNFIMLDNNQRPVFNETEESIIFENINTLAPGKLKYDQNKFTLAIQSDPIAYDDQDYLFDVMIAGNNLRGTTKFWPFTGMFKLDDFPKDKHKDPVYTKNNRTLFVSSGIGTYKTNIRIFNEPSINVFTLLK